MNNATSTAMSKNENKEPAAKAVVIREYGPFGDGEWAHGVETDGSKVWVAAGTKLRGFDPESGSSTTDISVPCDAGTAFDGTHFYQLAEAEILRVDPTSGEVVGRIPAPGGGNDSGLAWAEGYLWVGQYKDRKIHQIDAKTGEIIRTLESDRFVTGVTWVDSDLWHGTWENEQSELRRIDAKTGEVLESLPLDPGITVSGLTHDGKGTFYCGGGTTGKVRAVKKSRA